MIALFGGPLSRPERVALALGLVLSAVLMWYARAAVPDKAYVSLHIARHLAQGDGIVFNPGERVYGTTNPLWVTLLADGMSFGIDGLKLARLLGAASALLTVPLFLQLMRRTVRTPALRALGTVAWASQAWMARWAMSGIETPLAVALVLGGFVALTEGPDWGDRPVRTGALWALAAMTRPGAVLLLALWGTALLIDAQNRPGLRRLVFGLIAPVTIYGSWLLFARLYFGSFWPAVLSTPPVPNASIVEWWQRLVAEVGRIASTEGWIAGAGLLALVFSRPVGKPNRSACRFLPAAWVILLPALFAARGFDIASRHLLLVVPVVHWLAWWAVDRWWSGEKQEVRAWMRATWLGALLAAAVVGQNLVTYRDEVRADATRRERQVNETLVRWGRWLGTHAPPGSLLATDSPGALAYFGRVRIVDLNGVFTPALAGIQHRMSHRDLVARLAFASAGRARFLVDTGTPAGEMLAASPYAAAFETLDGTGQCAFYQLHWSRIRWRPVP